MVSLSESFSGARTHVDSDVVAIESSERDCSQYIVSERLVLDQLGLPASQVHAVEDHRVCSRGLELLQLCSLIV